MGILRRYLQCIELWHAMIIKTCIEMYWWKSRKLSDDIKYIEIHRKSGFCISVHFLETEPISGKAPQLWNRELDRPIFIFWLCFCFQDATFIGFCSVASCRRGTSCFCRDAWRMLSIWKTTTLNLTSRRHLSAARPTVQVLRYPFYSVQASVLLEKRIEDWN